MKILHVITGLTTGGAERSLLSLLSGGLARRFDCSVLSLGDKGTLGPAIEALGVPVHGLGMRAGLPSPSALLHLRRIVRTIQPDLIQGWMYHGNLAALVASVLLGTRPPLSFNIRQGLISLATEKPLTRQVIRANAALSHRAGALIYNSTVAATQHEGFGFTPHRRVIIPNGFDVAQFGPGLNDRVAVRTELGLGPDALVIGHVARFHPMKDHANFLRAAVSVARQVPHAQFLLVGREVTVDNVHLRPLVPPDLLPRFRFIGERPDVHRLMRALDVVCSSSWSEAFPNVLGEAMASAVPCVTTDVGDSAAIVGNTGLVVPPSDSAALAEALTTLLHEPPETRAARGQASRARITAQYSLAATVQRYATLYEELLGQSADGTAEPASA